MTLLLNIYFILIICPLIITFPQINFHLTDPINNPGLEHDCLRISISQEIVSFCLTDSMSEWNIQINPADNSKLTFNDLRKRNITSQQLYQWSASIDLIEQYQLFLNLNQSSLSETIFYNCTKPRFGPQCQYEFLYLPFENMTLKETISQFYQIEYEPTSLTCYIHLECDRGSKSICLDWTEICDEQVNCINNQIDEKFCGQLLINECREDEYRCRNGQCISRHFAFDQYQSEIYGCIDGSDVFGLNLDRIRKTMYLPTINREDASCALTYINTIIDLIKLPLRTCDILRRSLIQHAPINDKSKTLSNICFFTFSCIFYMEKKFLSICKDICAYKKCELLVNKTCPDIIIVPSVPLAFGHVHVGYHRRTDIEPSLHNPDFICYDAKLCRNFKSNVELLTIDNKTCRQIQDSHIQFRQIGWGVSTLNTLTNSVHKYLSHCNTILYEDANICLSPFTYHCQNSSKCISIYNLCNGFRDCDYGDDEICPLINGSCLPIESNVLFKCQLNNRCISSSSFGDNRCDCRRPNSKSCEDEPFIICELQNLEQCDSFHKSDYTEKYISFPTICDGFQELSPIFINGSNHTDETECQYWQCNNTYTRCDGFWNCLNGADEIDCEQNNALTNCSLNHHICIKPDTFEIMCLPLDKANNGHIDCLGATDEPGICRSKHHEPTSYNFYCDSFNNTRCSTLYSLQTSACMNQSEDLFWNLSNSIHRSWKCPNDNHSNSSYLVKYFCSRSDDIHKYKLTQFSLQITTKRTNRQPSQINVIKKSFEYNFQCHRGYPLRLWLFDHNQSSNDMIICFCPSSYYGRYCQYQNQRVSFTLKFQSYSDSRRTLFSLIIQLVDNTTQRIVHSAKQLTYVYVKHCQTKFNFYLTYSTRPKQSNRIYFIHIDVYEKLTFSYRGSLFIPLEFPFLPIHRVSYFLNIPRDNKSYATDCPEQCIHGQCMKYAENSSLQSFCHCNRGWTGKDCSISYNCTCSLDSLCAGIETNGRSICICPTDKWGPRCLLSNTNSTCLNNGQYVPNDDSLASEQKFLCLCPKGFSGDQCEINDAEIILSFDRNIIPSDSLLIHFIEVQENNSVRNGSTFQSISFYQKEIRIQWSRRFHIVFAELSHDHDAYYLINVEKDYNRSKVIRKLLTSQDRCEYMDKYVNTTILEYPLIRRIKYYHLPCQKQISCFYDRDHFCLCNNFGFHRLANCFRFDSTLEHNCGKLSNCQNEGQCIQDNVYCPQTSRCICRKCSYGVLCQFTSSLFDISLDGIIGPHIQPNVSFTNQPLIIRTITPVIILIVVIGLLNSGLLLLTFKSQLTRTVGCGYYLITLGITTSLTSIILIIKFSILLSTQMGLITNRRLLTIQCYSLDYLLQVCLFMNTWLNGCVAMERAFNIIKGTSFNKRKSKSMAKYMICCLVLMITISTIYDPIHRQLIDDEQERIWCIVSYSSKLAVFNQFIQICHFFVPLLLNIISVFIIIILATKRRQIIQSELSYQQVLSQQIHFNRHLLISPAILILLSLPRLIISFVAGCMETNMNPWIYSISYSVSFFPSMLIFIIFVSPSKLYKEEFGKTIR